MQSWAIKGQPRGVAANFATLQNPSMQLYAILLATLLPTILEASTESPETLSFKEKLALAKKLEGPAQQPAKEKPSHLPLTQVPKPKESTPVSAYPSEGTGTRSGKGGIWNVGGGPVWKPPQLPPEYPKSTPVPSALHVKKSVGVPPKGGIAEVPKGSPKSSAPAFPSPPSPRRIVYPNLVYGDAYERSNVKQRNGCTEAISSIVPYKDTMTMECPPIYDVDLGFTLTISTSCPESEIEKLIIEFDRDIDALAQPYSYPLLHGHPRYPPLVQIAENRLESGTMHAHVEGQTELNKLRDFLKRLDRLVVEKHQQLLEFDEGFGKKYSDLEDFQAKLKLMPYKIYGRDPRPPLPSSDILMAVKDAQEFLSTPLYGVTEVPEGAMRALKRAEFRLKKSDYYDKQLESLAERQWQSRTRRFDQAVVDRYELYEEHIESIKKSEESAEKELHEGAGVVKGRAAKLLEGL